MRPLEDLVSLCKTLFGIDLFPYQEQIIRHIVNDSRKVTIRATTRAGKSYAVAIGAILYCLFNDNKRVGLIAPTGDKSKVIMDYCSALLTSHPSFLDFVILESGSSKLERQRRELSKRKLSFNNGTILEIRSVNLQMKGFGVTGFGYDLNIIDESAEIPDECYSKIYRMLVESKDAKIVEIGNPWFLNHFYRNHHSNDWIKIHISWQDCVSQGRMSQEDIDDQRAHQSDLEFKVLFDADFPDSEEDTLFPQQFIKQSFREINFKGEVPKFILGVDCARFGRNKTVFTYTAKYGRFYQVLFSESYTKLSVTSAVGHILDFLRRHPCTMVNIDAGGLGGGVYDGVVDYFEDSGTLDKRPVINEIMLGSKALNPHHRDLKASIFFHLSSLFKERRIGLSEDVRTNDLLNQLSLFRYDFTKTGKMKVLDGQDSSPDFADSLAYSCWDVSDSVIIDW